MTRTIADEQGKTEQQAGIPNDSAARVRSSKAGRSVATVAIVAAVFFLIALVVGLAHKSGSLGVSCRCA
jgi:hypothetical protein